MSVGLLGFRLAENEGPFRPDFLNALAGESGRLVGEHMDGSGLDDSDQGGGHGVWGRGSLIVHAGECITLDRMRQMLR